MPGIKKWNSDLELRGKAMVYTVPNSMGTVLTYNDSTKEISQRTNTQIIADLGLITATNIAAAYYTKTQLQTSGQAQVHWNNLTNVPTTFTPSVHNHDDRYYTETESDNKFVPYTGATQNVNLGDKNLDFTSGAISKTQNNIRHFRDVYHGLGSTVNTADKILSIKFPPQSAQATMFRVEIDFYQYTSNSQVYNGKLILSFYKTSNSVIHASNGLSFYWIGDKMLPTNIIKVGFDPSGNIAINIGDSTTDWFSYTSFRVSSVEAKFTGWAADHSKGWTHEFVSDETGYTSLVTVPLTISANQDWVNTQITNAGSNYLPLAGGTMNSSAAINWNAGSALIQHSGINRIRLSSANTIISSVVTGTTLGIYLRPRGDASSAGQVTIDGNGQINTANHGNSSQWKQAYDWVTNGGISRTSQSLNNTDDLDLIVTPGYYHHNAGSAPLNIPVVTAGYLEVINNGLNNFIRQAWRGRDNTLEYQRTRSSLGVWSDWALYYNSDNFNPANYASSTHTHVISDVTGLQTALDDKVDDSQVLTNVPAGAVFTDTVYTHPTTAGNKHIPAGGAAGQILRWSANGTAVWGADNDTTYPVFTGTTTAGLVPARVGSTTTKYLREDGTWTVPPNTNTTYTAGTGLTLTTTTFSVNYGTTAGTAAQGNDSRINNGQTAFGWGNHATQGYITNTALGNYVTLDTVQTITGSKTFTGSNSFNNTVSFFGSIYFQEDGYGGEIGLVDNDDIALVVKLPQHYNLFGQDAGTLYDDGLMRSNVNWNYGIDITPSASYKLSVGGSIYASGFVKSGGTASQFLKADGSIDSNVYAVQSGANGTGPWSHASQLIVNNGSATGVTKNNLDQTVSLQDATQGTGMGYLNNYGIAAGNPSDAWFYKIKMLHSNALGYYGEIALDMSSLEVGSLWFKCYSAGTDYGWRKALDDRTDQIVTGKKRYSSTGNSFTDHALEVYSTSAAHPAITFHNAGQYGGSIAMTSANMYEFRNLAGTDVVNTRANISYSQNGFVHHGYNDPDAILTSDGGVAYAELDIINDGGNLRINPLEITSSGSPIDCGVLRHKLVYIRVRTGNTIDLVDPQPGQRFILFNVDGSTDSEVKINSNLVGVLGYNSKISLYITNLGEYLFYDKGEVHQGGF